VEIEILAPPRLFAEKFDDSTPTITVEGVKILKPTLILNAKCRSIFGRADERKKQSDATDIRFLLQWCATNGVYPTAEEVPNADKELVSWLINKYPGQDSIWTNARYDWEKGPFPFSLFQTPTAN